MSKIEELIRIKNLLDEGLISFEEFEKLKIRIIDNKSEKNNFQSNIDEVRKEIDRKKEVLREGLEDKKCPNCNKELNIKDLSCNSCGYSFITRNIPVSHETQETIDGKSDLNRESIFDKEDTNNQQNSNRIFYSIFGVVLILIFGVWFYMDSNNKRFLKETISEKSRRDSISLVKSKDSVVEELKKYKTKSYNDSIALVNQQIDTTSNENNILNENSNLIIGEDYGGGTIVYLDDSKKHGLICSELIITDRVNTFEISQSESKKYSIINSGNWRLPSKSEFGYIKDVVDLKDETFWTDYSGYVYMSSYKSVRASRNNWQSSALIFVKDF